MFCYFVDLQYKDTKNFAYLQIFWQLFFKNKETEKLYRTHVNISLAILAEGYDSERLVVNSKSPKKIDIDLKPNRKHIIVSTEPNYAAIYINGRETAKGKADFYIYKNEKKTIKVVADGYDTYSKQFDFNDFNLQQESVHVTLESNIH